MASRGGDSNFAAGMVFVVLIAVFGSGWLFDAYGWVLERRGQAEAELVESASELAADVVDGGPVTLPDVAGVDLPDTDLTGLDVPDVDLPVDLPDIDLPDVDLPIDLDDLGLGGDGDPQPAVTIPPSADGYAPRPTWNDPFPTPTVNDYTEAWARLEAAPIAPTQTSSKYDRETWMPNGWQPIDGVPDGIPALEPGCTVREWLFVLWAEPGSGQQRDDCYTVAGNYVDGYIEGAFTVPDDREVRAVDGEHLIALVEAHLSGGDQWDPVLRNTFATDYTIRSYHEGGTQLLLADGPENQHVKNLYDTAGYLPATETSRCGFVVSVIAVKDRYGLAFDAEETSALIDQLTTCEAGGIPPRP